MRARICAIGPATRAAIEALHLKVDLMGKEYVAEGLLAAFAAHDLAGQRILLPRAAVARDLVPVELAQRGAQVDVVEAYRTVAPTDCASRSQARLDNFHKFLHIAKLCGCVGRGLARWSEGGVHRSGHFGHRAQVGD